MNEATQEAEFVGTAVVFYYDQLGVGNLGYRLTPSVRGPGRATELACEAPSGAARIAPKILVSARVLT
jgi:RimJ/RimL family protein N-acetyltransferase